MLQSTIGLSCVLALAIGQLVIAQATTTKKTITGTVVTVDDKPAQTHVQLFSLKLKPTGPTPRPPGVGPTGDPSSTNGQDAIPLQRLPDKPFKETDTDTSGKFTFTDVPLGPYAVVAGSGRNTAKVSVDVKPNEDLKPLALKLPSK
jgi:hypothetical protein